MIEAFVLSAEMFGQMRASTCQNARNSRTMDLVAAQPRLRYCLRAMVLMATLYIEIDGRL